MLKDIYIRDAMQLDGDIWRLYLIIGAIVTMRGLLKCEMRLDSGGQHHLFVFKEELDPAIHPAFAAATPEQRKKLAALGKVSSSDFVKRALLHEPGVVELEPGLYGHSFQRFRLVSSEEGDALYCSFDELVKQQVLKEERARLNKVRARYVTHGRKK